MAHLTRMTTAVLLLGISMLPASAQTTVTTTTRTVEPPGAVVLTPTQRTTIYRTVTRERRAAPAREIDVNLGATIPSAVELRMLPEGIYVEVPTIKRYKYMVVNNEVVLVDPETSRVVEIIRE